MTRQGRRHRPVRRAAYLATHYFHLAGTVTLGVLPLALLAAPHPWFSLGVAYAIWWFAIIIPTSAAAILVILDGLLMAMGRWPVLSHNQLVLARQELLDRASARRILRLMRRLIAIGYWLNPLSALADASIEFAHRLRPDVVHDMFDWVETEAAELQRRHILEHVTPVRNRDVIPEITHPYVLDMSLMMESDVHRRSDRPHHSGEFAHA